MAIAGFGKTQITYDMFDMVRSAEEAKRFVKCEKIYHRGQDLAWDGKTILDELLKQHGGIHVDPIKKKSLERVFAIIMWGELAAWKISAQLADGLLPLEAKMAATSQAHDEARHFYVMHDYLTELGYVPERLDRAPQALLDLVLQTDSMAHKLLGMQLMIENIALTVFQTVRELEVEPVITELMKYYERDEARHVGLGMQYLPSVLEGMSRREVSSLITFQVRLMFWALYELKVLAPDLEVLGIDPRMVIDRARKKQLAALQSAFEAIGIPLDRDRNAAAMTLNAAVEFLFPEDKGKKASVSQRFESAWTAFWRKAEPIGVAEAFADHTAHAIKTARGMAAPERPFE